MKRRIAHLLALISLVLVPLLAAFPAAPSPAAAQEIPSGDVIVVLNDEVIPADIRQLLNTLPVTVAFANVFTGFAANLTESQSNALAQSPIVAGIYPDLPVSVAVTDATGVRRIGAPSASTTGEQPAVNATAAVIDSGVQYNHPNLNVVGGFDAWGAYASGTGVVCGDLTPQQAAQYEGNGAGTWGSSSNNGHGTHVAGTIAARGLDGVVGVAPGASIVGVRALSGTTGTTTSIICGIDWVIANQDRFGGIDAVNLSIQGPAVAGDCTSDPVHAAICQASAAGLPIVAAAGNTTGTPNTFGLYDEVIAVSGFNDYDGLPGGNASPPGDCNGATGRPDDRLGSYSLTAGADIMAPGTCILSTWVGSGYGVETGTSMSAAHVTGTVLLGGGGSPGQARSYVLANSVPQSDAAGLVVSGVSNGEPVLHLGESPEPPVEALAITGSFQSNGASSATVTYDGDMSTIWTSAGGAPSTAWFTLDLGEVTPIGTLRWVFGSGHGSMADAWQIQLSNDNTNWVTIRNRGNAAPGDWKDQAIDRNARYIRFFFTNPNGESRLGGVAEVEVLPADGPTTDLPDPTPTPTPTSTPEPGDPYPITNAGRSSGSGHPSLAYDGDMSTVWVTHTSSVPSSAYIYFSLGSPQAIGSVRWVFGSGYGGLADSWQIQVSNDRVTWVTVANRGNASPRDWKEQAVNLEATFVRFQFSNPNGDPRLGGIAEVEILPASGAVASLPDTEPTPTATTTVTATATATATSTPADAYAFSMASRSSASSHPSLVYDGNPSTEWITTSSSVPSSAYIYVSIGGVKPIGEVRWVFATSEFADSYDIQISNDRQSWTTVETRSNAPAGEWQSLAVNQDGHYIRFLFSNPNGTAKLGGIGEIEVYPPAEPTTASEGAETATPTETATETATATETEPVVTETVTPAETVVPTETATEEPTETVTTEPTTTEEPSPTEPVTEEPTETVTEEATVEAAAETEVATEEPVIEETEAPWTPGPGLYVAGSFVSEQSAEGWTVLDGDALTDWRTWPGTALPEAELGFDLGQVSWVSELWWLVAIDAPGGRIIVETSVDGETWQLIGERPMPGDPGAWMSMPLGVEARFVRFRFINDAGADQLGGIAEVVLLP